MYRYDEHVESRVWLLVLYGTPRWRLPWSGDSIDGDVLTVAFQIGMVNSILYEMARKKHICED